MRFIKAFCIIVALFALTSGACSCNSKHNDIDDITSNISSETEWENVESSSDDADIDSTFLETESESEPIDSNPFANVTMACLGDSITMATKVVDPYPTVVKNILGMQEVYNHGVSWSTLSYIDDCWCHPDSDYNHDPYVFRYDELEDADIIAIMGGVNDWGCLIPIGDLDDVVPTTFYGALNILITQLKADHPDSYIFMMTGFDYYDVEKVDAYNRDKVYWREFNEAIVAVCEKYDIDCFDVFHEVPVNRDVDMIDGTHPTQEFINNVWAPMIADFIRENYEK